MALIDDLKERRKAANELHHEFMRNAFTWQSNADIEAQLVRDLDIAIAALTPAPAPVEIEIPEGFTKWEGGECPVPHGKIVDIICRDPDVRVGQTNQVFAHMISWANEGSSAYDIIAYRIIEAPPVADEQDDASELAQLESEAADLQYAIDSGQISLEGLSDDDTPAEHISILTGDPAIEPETGLHGDDWCPEYASAERPALNEAMQDEREEPVTDVAALIASGEHSYDEVAAIAYPEPDGYAPVTNPEADALARAHDYYDPKAVAERNRFNPFAMFRREPEEV